MSTKKITITNPEDFKAGDTYYGTFVRVDQPGIKTVVDGGTLTKGISGRLYVLGLGSTSYVDVVADNGRSNGHWTDFHATREVEEPDLPSKQGIWLYHSYGLDKDGDLSRFPNLILHLSESPEHGWYRVTNASAVSSPMTADQVRRELPHMAPLTLKEVD